MMVARKENKALYETDRPLNIGMSAAVFFVGASLLIVKYFYIYGLTNSSAVLADILESAIILSSFAYSLIVYFAKLFMDTSDSDAINEIDRQTINFFSAGFGGTLILLATGFFLFFSGFPQLLSPGKLNDMYRGSIGFSIVTAVHILWLFGVYKSGAITDQRGRIIGGGITSAVVLIGLFIVGLTDFYRLDGLIACVIGLRILVLGIELFLMPFQEFKDVLEPDFLNAVYRLFNEYRKDIWIDIHKLRTWFKDNNINVEFHLILPRDLTLEVANREPADLNEMLNEQFGKSAKVLVHIEPCVETDCPYCSRDNCKMRSREKPKREHRWTLASLTSEEGPSERFRIKDWEAPAHLMSKAIEVADYNTRLLEWLFDILAVKGIDHELLMENLESVEIEHRGRVLAEELLKQMSPGLQRMLAVSSVYQIPVPKTAITAACRDIPGLDDHMDRAVALGLLEVDRQLSFRVYRVPPNLWSIVKDYSPGDMERVCRNATLNLYSTWWYESENPTEKQALEILRLATESRERRIAVEITDRISGQWIRKGRLREAINLCLDTMKTVGDDYRILRNLAMAEKSAGRPDTALKYYQQSLQLCPNDDDMDKAAILHNMAVLYTRTGHSTKALTLFQHSLEIKEAAKNDDGMASTLTWIALIYGNRGKTNESLKIYEQALEIQERIGDEKGRAATLNQIANIYTKQELFEEALFFFQQSYEYIEQKGSLREKAALIIRIADIQAKMNRVKKALALYKELREIKRKIGDKKGESEAVAMMSKLSVLMLQNLKNQDSNKIREFPAQVK